ncbi:hypothetical protein WICANDRAFT_62255 [Wickerhamomyces anomalus NRRL Y-366-8]|uniref:Major facilitator superfamily (MFS) profile domain-containing protein n=1 Tax=Wickerhamomyces anomalus (strain ATCC 58044 / CBS 1984 / NCYC 433 / NRRL Y-366-8) TaxID=683960 RepID=A0A1E3P2F3_WICAA|nr:uncharacterized protein WICANDRAFT_62255 [Wickerhamomyces anomalus NRRL Y-366-8]ODQ59669.1 hypothetical protein WICANDRAFT_62255 [Wickerhamomyces anomalus NRRL Y-366-8]
MSNEERLTSGYTSPLVNDSEKKKKEDHNVSTKKLSKHTVFDKSEKYILVLLAASTAIWSSFGSPIYYPALQILENYFDISEELVNVSVVVYMICQGISPTVFAPFADRYGRRPVLIVCLLIFIGSSIGLAVSNSYALILVLRCIQSFGISPAVAIACGITGDWTERKERGWFVGLTSGFTLFGQAFGALIGAALIAAFDWRAIFWFLAIGGCVTLLVMLCCLPETMRSIVGNGSITPKHFIDRAPALLIPYYKRKWDLDDPDYSTLAPQKKTDFLASLKILKKPELAICLLNGAIHYGLWTVQLTSLTNELSKSYGYSVMKIGLCYLPAGVGGLFGSFYSGRILDWVYRREYVKFEDKKKAGLIGEYEKFNIVKSRVLVAVPYTIVTDGFTLMYGWCLAKKVHVSTVLVSEFLISNGCMALVGINTTLLIDLYASNSSAATSCVNLTRCLTGAIFVAALTSMNKSMTIGGTFTLMCALGLISGALLYIPLKFGMKWSAARDAREQRKRND